MKGNAMDVRGWLSSWTETLRIMIFHRETYRFLKGSTHDRDTLTDFIEVHRPEGE